MEAPNTSGRPSSGSVWSPSLLVLPGDGIGPEITEATVSVLKAAGDLHGIEFRFSEATIGFDALRSTGTTLPDNVLPQAMAADGVILGPVSHNDYPPAAEGGLNPSGQLRKRLDLYANVRPARSRPGLPSRVGKPIDLVTVRENTEGFYADRTMFAGEGEIMPTPDLALAFRKITRAGSLRIAETAFELARRRKKLVTVVHKANVLRVSDGLFLECVREVAARFPDVAYREQLVDAMAALLVRDPSQFDVLLATNMFGDILSDEAAEVAGSLGLAGSLNAGSRFAVAQAQHGSAPGIAGQNKANPCSLVESAAMLLAWLAERSGDARLAAAASAIQRALDETIEQPERRTSDIGGPASTTAFTGYVIEALRAAPDGG